MTMQSRKINRLAIFFFRYFINNFLQLPGSIFIQINKLEGCQSKAVMNQAGLNRNLKILPAPIKDQCTVLVRQNRLNAFGLQPDNHPGIRDVFQLKRILLRIVLKDSIRCKAVDHEQALCLTLSGDISH